MVMPRVGGGVGEDTADVAVDPEPQAPTVGQRRGQGLGDEQAAAVAGGEPRRVIEEGPRVEDLEDLGVGVAHHAEILDREQPQAL